MLAGALYLASDPELVEGRRRARRLARQYNATMEEEETEQLHLLTEWLGGVGASPFIEPPFLCDYGSNLFLGDRVYINFGCIILDCARVHIGNDVMIAPQVQIYTAHHPIDAHKRIAGPELASPITIGDRI